MELKTRLTLIAATATLGYDIAEGNAAGTHYAPVQQSEMYSVS